MLILFCLIFIIDMPTSKKNELLFYFWQLVSACHTMLRPMPLWHSSWWLQLRTSERASTPEIKKVYKDCDLLPREMYCWWISIHNDGFSKLGKSSCLHFSLWSSSTIWVTLCMQSNIRPLQKYLVNFKCFLASKIFR